MKVISQRCRRVGDQLKSEISIMLLKEVKDPRIGFVTVMDVEVSPDLSRAEVYFSVFGSDEEREESLAGLKSTAAWMRREMGRRLHLKRIPALHFRYDDTPVRGEHLEELLARIHRESDEVPE